MCEAWGREKARMNRMSQARGRGVVVLLANAEAEGRRPAWRACGENVPLVLSPHAKKNAACASRRLDVGCSLFVNHNKNQTKETPTRIGGGGNEGGTRVMTANARAKEEEGELKEGGLHMRYHFIDRCHQVSRHFQAIIQSHALM